MTQKMTVPEYKKHRKTGRTTKGFVEINGSRKYFPGEYDSDESISAYKSFVTELLANDGCQKQSAKITIAELAAEYIRWSDKYYDSKGHKSDIDTITKALLSLYEATPARDFGPMRMKAVRQKLIDNQHCRTSINKLMVRLRHLFKWGVEHELIPADVHHGLQAVQPLRYGKTEAKESEPVKPVSQAHIDTVRQHVNRSVRALIDLQLLTGARPGELVTLKYQDIDTSDKVWAYRPDRHKNKYRGHNRTIFFGPAAQAIIRELVQIRPIGAYLFTPTDFHRERVENAENHRRPNQKPNKRKTDRRIGDCYTVDGYRRAIHTACDTADIPVWGPHRLRHNAGTALRKQYGAEVARVLLGHKHLAVTEIYSEIDIESAKKIMSQIG